MNANQGEFNPLIHTYMVFIDVERDQLSLWLSLMAPNIYIIPVNAQITQNMLQTDMKAIAESFIERNEHRVLIDVRNSIPYEGLEAFNQLVSISASCVRLARGGGGVDISSML